MTGRYPASHRYAQERLAARRDRRRWPRRCRTPATPRCGIVTNYNVAPFFNFHQGFDEYRYLEPNFVLGADDTAAKLLFVQLLRQRIETMRAKRGQVEPGSAYQDAERVNARAAALPRSEARRRRCTCSRRTWIRTIRTTRIRTTAPATRAPRTRSPTPTDADLMRKLYDGEITFWDEHFGKLVAELKRRGLYDDLTIVITADHGEEFMDHGGFWHGTTLYDEQVRVPLLLKLPRGERGGSVVQHWVESVDIMPTLLRAERRRRAQGRAGQGPVRGRRQRVRRGETTRATCCARCACSAAQSELKLIEANAGNPRGLQPYELFRMDQDPRELVNLARDDAETLGVAATNLERRATRGRRSARRAASSST